MTHASLLSADLRARRVRRRSLAVLLFVLLAFSAALGPPVEPAGGVLDESALMQATAEAPPIEVEAPPTLEQLQARVAAVLAREGVPGVGLAVVDRNGVRWAGGVGVADLGTGEPVGPDTQFRVASITKSFVGLGVMRLVEQGRLDLGRPLREFMPDIALTNDWEASSPITLAHALEHTTGFDEMRFNEYFTADDATVPRDALAINPRSRVARWRPGSRSSYANPGYTLAGHAIELATGESYDTYLEREVLRPLGMPTARFRRTPNTRTAWPPAITIPIARRCSARSTTPRPARCWPRRASSPSWSTSGCAAARPAARRSSAPSRWRASSGPRPYRTTPPTPTTASAITATCSTRPAGAATTAACRASCRATAISRSSG
ncbi:serine hydrolase domain-containing protein [Nannocystis pusilla]|uniref:serine hydrolase domain-containing protein n=1 Tax=Nannocystis pusilla TaxID=889268 RepID=UPI003B788A78